jgi:hypothetical protein
VTAPLSAREVRVGVLIDGPSAREDVGADALEHAATAVYGDGLTLTAAPQKRLNGNWSVPALNAALDRLEADPQVDVVVTLGFAASHLVAHRARLPKPTIAATVLDPVLQTFPVKGGTSGRHNFTYVTTFNRVDDQIGTFHRIIGFSHLIEVAVPSEERLVVNMHTAQLIGFSPHWDDLTDAVQVGTGAARRLAHSVPGRRFGHRQGSDTRRPSLYSAAGESKHPHHQLQLVRYGSIRARHC